MGMSHSVVLGKSGGKNISLDLDTLVRTRLLIQASSGGGKSWALRRLLEQTHGKVQHIVLDPEGEFSTLREKFDYVLVGQGGDVSADWRHAELLARRLMELGASAILDLYELKPSERRHYAHVFLESFINLPKDLWHPCLVVVDEAHTLCPEKSAGESEATESVIELATRGRKRGYCAVLGTQRLSKLHKDATAELRNRLIGMTTEDIDRKRAGEELGLRDKDQILALRKLEPGDFNAFGPAISNEIIKVRIGPVETSHPDIGRRAARPSPPREKVRAILSKMADLPKEAEEEARTVEGLRQTLRQRDRDIRDLKVQLKAGVQQPLAETVRTTVERFMVTKAQIRAMERAAVALSKSAETVLKATGPVTNSVERMVRAAESSKAASLSISHSVQKAGSAPSAPSLMQSPSVPLARFDRTLDAVPLLPRPKRADRGSDRADRGADSRLGKAERAILAALAQYPQGRTIKQTAVLAGYAVGGGGFRNALGALRTKGYVSGRGGNLIVITDVGLDALGRYEPLPEPGLALVSHWLSQLGHAEGQILNVLADRYPDSLPIADVAAATTSSRGGPYDPDGGGFRNALGRLRTLELVEGRSSIKASDALMGR